MGIGNCCRRGAEGVFIGLVGIMVVEKLRRADDCGFLFKVTRSIYLFSRLLAEFQKTKIVTPYLVLREDGLFI